MFDLNRISIASHLSGHPRKGGTLTNVLVFLSAACVVGFVSWLLLQHIFFKTSKNYTVEKPVVMPIEEPAKEQPVELTAEERMQIQKEIDRRKAEKERMLAEKEKKERAQRIKKNLSMVQQFISFKKWKLAEVHIGLLLDDEYSLEEVATFNDAIAKGKLKERADLLEVQKLSDAAKKLDLGKYSPEAIDLLDRALLIYPNHAPTVELMKKINAYPYTLRVPEDVASLNDAVDMLRAGDTAILGKGIHKLPAMLDKGVKIKGQGETQTTIECDTTITSAFTLTGLDQFYSISDLTVIGTNYEDDATERFPLILLTGDANLTMQNVTVKNGSGHGVAVMSGSLKMTKCKLTQNAWDGISIMGVNSYAEITDSDISKNYDHGVDFWKGASGKLSNVTANGNIGSGILIMGKGAKVHLIQVKTERNSQCGIVINSQAEAQLERVFSSDNLLSGIVVQGRGTKLTCGITVASKNGEAGFFIDPDAQIENFISATAEKNGQGDIIRKSMVIPNVPAPQMENPVPDETGDKL